MTTTAKIGAFFLVVLGLLAVLVMKIEDIPFGKQARTVAAEVQFRDVAGLDDKSAVRIAGVRVGKVDGIRLLPDGTAVARLLLERDVELRVGATGQIRNMGLLGDKYIELFPGIPGGARLGPGVRIPGIVPTGFDELTKLAGDIGKDVKELTAAFSSSMGGDKGAEKLNRIVDNVGALAEALRKLVEANRDNVDATMGNLKLFAAEIRETLARVDRILDENRTGVKETVGNLDSVTGKLKTTADNLNSITGKIDTGNGTIGKLLNSEETHQNLNDALQAVKGGVDSLNTTLTRINRIELDLGFRGEYTTRDNGGRAYFTLDVVPRENKFYRLEVGSGRRRDTTETTTVLLPDGSNTTTVKQIQTVTDEFTLSAQMGIRKANTQFRAGLFDWYGGVGVDQFFLQDKVLVGAEASDFARPGQYARVKLHGRWMATPIIFLTGGMDQTLNPGLRTAFIGAGIRWRDEDVKSILGFSSLLR
jgi:phospholipid/cholesterol/gamma-HCH transport system substrate-binding protein